MGRDNAGIGRSQKLVLHLLALGSGEKSVRQLSYDWPDLTESAARGAVMRLGDRSLVDVAGWEDNRRTYKLTERGWEVVGEIEPTPGTPSRGRSAG